MSQGFEILYEEGPCLLVLKPAGVLTQAPPGIDSLELRVKRFLKKRDEKPGNVYLGVPHRLDRPVSGVMVLAKHVRAARRISEQFEGRIVDKEYWAVVEGHVEEDSGTWRDHVRKTPGKPMAEVVPEDHPDARHAVLHFRVLQRTDTLTWLSIQLETGRTHQIRLQASSRGLPVFGDFQYGARQPFGPDSDNERLRSIALHARSLTLRHPMTKQKLAAIAAAPESWSGLGLDLPEGPSEVNELEV